MKASQKVLEERVTDINVRLGAVELKVCSLESLQDSSGVPQPAAEAIRSESAALEARLDDYEDRSRRENLIFYGIQDVRAETWGETEGKVRAILKDRFSLELPSEGISRAHRLGSFVPNKCRPVIVKFTFFKVKETILSRRAKLKGTNISLQEDYCKGTRLSRKKLLDFGKESGHTYSLRYNKLYADKKCYIYCRETDSVCEVESYIPPSAEATTSQSSGRLPAPNS